MSTLEEIEKIVANLKRKKNLKPYEQRFLEIYENETCDREKMRELILEGRDKYIERNYKADIKEAGRKFITGAKEGGKSLGGNWAEAPPPPPQFPEDCVIM
jgi:hypothetical protein